MLVIGPVKNDRGVKLGSLKVGDTFLYDNRAGLMVMRNGHTFPIDLTTCGNFRKNGPGLGPELPPNEIVLPIDIELTLSLRPSV